MSAVMGYQRIPPLTFCRECGKRHRSWAEGALCRECVRTITQAVVREHGESLREFRRRLQS